MTQARSLKWPTYLGLVVAMGWPFALLALGHAAGAARLADRGIDSGILIREWSVLALLVAIMVFGERLTAASVGLKMPNLVDIGCMFLMIVVTFVGNGVAFSIAAALSGGPLNPPSLAGLLSIPIAMRVAMAVTAGVCEEFLSRGYAIERLTALTGNRFIGAAVPAIMFTLGHVRLYGFGVGLLPVLATSISLTLLYVWRRNLVVNVAAHALIDLYGLLIQPLQGQGH